MREVQSYLTKLSEQENELSVHDKIYKFFGLNPNPSDEEVHRFAKELGIDPPEFERHIYVILSSLLKGIGKHKHVNDDAFDLNELRMGVEVELEHTDDRMISKEIAKDHLAECKDYYTRLERMEGECEKALMRKEV